MIPDADERIEKLNNFLQLLDEWGKTHSGEVRTRINRTKNAVQREVIEAGCLYRMTISPPASVGGMIMQNINPFDMIFDQVYLQSFNSHVRDIIDQTIGIIEERRNLPDCEETRNEPEIAYQVQKGYVFVAMPINPANPFDDVLDAIKETCKNCGLIAVGESLFLRKLLWASLPNKRQKLRDR